LVNPNLHSHVLHGLIRVVTLVGERQYT
jgi:hypothetical protein